MAADSDGDLIETVVTCEGDLEDPEFPHKFKIIIDRLKALLCNGNLIKFHYVDMIIIPYIYSMSIVNK